MRPSASGLPAQLSVPRTSKVGQVICCPELVHLGDVEEVRRGRAHVVVELPAVGAVLVLVHAVDRSGGAPVRARGAGSPPACARSAPRSWRSGAAGGRRARAARRPSRRMRSCGGVLARSSIIAGGGPRPSIATSLSTFSGIHAGVAQLMCPPSEWPMIGHRREPALMHELGDVVDVVDHAVVAADQPLRIAVPAQVGRDDVVVVAQLLGRPVPVPAVVATAVHAATAAARLRLPQST